MIYIQEAHASDAWQLEVNEKENVIFEDPQDYETRVNLAGTCSANLGIEMPALVDTIENKTEIDYTAWPDRIYVVDRNGHVAFKSDAGPFGFKTGLLSEALGKLLSSENQNEQ